MAEEHTWPIKAIRIIPFLRRRRTGQICCYLPSRRKKRQGLGPVFRRLRAAFDLLADVFQGDLFQPLQAPLVDVYKRQV